MIDTTEFAQMALMLFGVLPRDGRAAGLIEGKELGLQKGLEIGSEVGFYAGFCEVRAPTAPP